MFFIVALVVISIALLYLVLQLPISGAFKFFLVFAEMIIAGQVLIRKYKLDSELGLILLKSKKGLEIIDSFAGRPKIWTYLSDVGSTISYGLMSAVILRKNSSVKTIIPGLLLLLSISLFVAPSAIYFLSKVLTTEELMLSASEGSGIGFGGLELLVILLFAGFFGVLLVGIITYALVILNSIVGTFLYGTDALANINPGGTFLLPGVNLPFVEGILALVVIMLVHEGAHAVLARIAKVPVTSSGIVLFGIIPIGAFIEPDEKLLAKVEDTKQTRVLIAGSTSNFFFSAVFFLLFLLSVFFASISGFDGLAGGFFRFLYTFLGLTFSLNFIVGTVNLLPIPFFDGYRLLELNIKHKKLVQALMAITLVAFILNFLPWLFR